MSDVSHLFVSRFDSIEKEFDADDFATMSEVDSTLKSLKAGEIAKLVTHAVRRIIVIGTPLGTITIGEAYPRDPSRLRLISPSAFSELLYPNRLDDYMTVEDLHFFLGSELLGANIGLRLADACAAMMHKATHNEAGEPYTVSMDTPE